MSDYLVASSNGAYSFNFTDLVEQATEQLGATFFPREAQHADLGPGELQVYLADGHVAVNANLLRDGGGIGLEGPAQHVADFIAWLTARDGFPTDGSVVLVNWTDDMLPLQPGTRAADLLAASH